jgi:divinyl protochlorophyllide a 8-vinyl-reductase
MQGTGAVAIAGRIGPNAIIRAAEAMSAAVGEGRSAQLLRAAGLGAYVGAPPERMVDEGEVTRLHRVLRTELGAEPARSISREAGVRTGDYLLAHRIPQPVQTLLRALPASLACRLLLLAIRRHAWTFAGSGVFSARAGNPTRLSVAGCPICRGAEMGGPLCDYYSATFECLFRELVCAEAKAIETACQADGAEACTFEVRW